MIEDPLPSQRLVGSLAEKLGTTFTPETARAVLDLGFEEPSVERRQALAARANEGLLTPEERAEYETYLQFRVLLSLLQSKARRFLHQHGLPA